MNEQKNPKLLREIGNKLANFRRKLATETGQKIITQLEFGEMFGKYSKRQITSYETGEVDAPASLLYLIWQSGNSIDGIFNEQPISEEGARRAKILYDSLSIEESKRLDEEAIDRAIKEAENVKAGKTAPTQETPESDSSKGKERHSKARTVKKR